MTADRATATGVSTLSDDPPPTDPAPAPVPDAPQRAPDGFVRGGTTTLAWDLSRQELAQQADRRRAQQDNRIAAIESARRNPQSGVMAALLSMQLGSHRNPVIVLTYKARDSAMDQECIADLVVVSRDGEPGETDLAFVVVCPKCLERTGRQDQSQVLVRQSVRHFWLDETKARQWFNERYGDYYRVAGNVTTKEAVKCDALGCNWRFRIDDSVLQEV